MAETTITAVSSSPAERRAPEALEFPGCRPVRISRDDIADYEGRFEFWDADTEIAMVCEPTSYYHERPLHRLAKLTDRIAAARGAPIEAVGHTDLLLRNLRGERQRIMQADQILFLRPVQAIPRGKAIEVGMDALPDVVLEVDNTTDVRRGKLGLYESWGFPEVWVEVPDEPEANRPRSLRPGLTIHLRVRDGFRAAPVGEPFRGRDRPGDRGRGVRSEPGFRKQGRQLRSRLRAGRNLQPSRQEPARQAGDLRRVGRAGCSASLQGAQVAFEPQPRAAPAPCGEQPGRHARDAARPDRRGGGADEQQRPCRRQARDGPRQRHRRACRFQLEGTGRKRRGGRHRRELHHRGAQVDRGKGGRAGLERPEGDAQQVPAAGKRRDGDGVDQDRLERRRGRRDRPWRPAFEAGGHAGQHHLQLDRVADREPRRDDRHLLDADRGRALLRDRRDAPANRDQGRQHHQPEGRPHAARRRRRAAKKRASDAAASSPVPISSTATPAWRQRVRHACRWRSQKRRYPSATPNRRTPVSGSTSSTAAPAGRARSNGSAMRTAITSWARAAGAQLVPIPVGLEVRQDDAHAAPLQVGGHGAQRQRQVGPASGRACVQQVVDQAQHARPPACRRHPRLDPVTEQAGADAVVAELRRQCQDRRHPDGQVALFRRAGQHRGRTVRQQQDGQLALLPEHLGVGGRGRPAEPRGDVPVDGAHVVAVVVLAHLVELDASEREAEIAYVVDFRIGLGSDPAAMDQQRITLVRELLYTPEEIVAKEHEEDLIREELRREAAAPDPAPRRGRDERRHVAVSRNETGSPAR